MPRFRGETARAVMRPAAAGPRGEHAKLWGAAFTVTPGLSSPPASALTPFSEAVPRALQTGGPLGPGTSPHDSVRMLSTAIEADIAEIAGLLLDLARVQDGDSPRDPAAFARRVAEALAGSPA